MKDKWGTVRQKVGGNVSERQVLGENVVKKITRNFEVYQSFEMKSRQKHLNVEREVNILKISKCGSNLKKINLRLLVCYIKELTCRNS